jgi:hypothetical protein
MQLLRFARLVSIRWLFAASVVAPAGLAAAQPSAADDAAARKEAKEAFSAGERAFARGDHAAALAQFERAFTLKPHDAVRFNIAVCLEGLGRHAEALAQYRAAAKSSELSQAERTRAERAGKIALGRVGTLIVEGSVGAVSVGGSERCRAPCRVELDPGSYDVLVGAAPSERRVTISIQAGRDFVLPAPAAAPPPAQAPLPPPPPVEAPPPAQALEPTYAPTWLTWTGASIAVVGGSGIIGFGLWADGLHDDYVRAPTQERLDQGVLARNLTNASIGVAALGAVLVAVDLIFIAPTAGPPANATSGRAERVFVW